jgi:hypothetical protein
VDRGHGEDVALVALPKRMVATTRQYMDEDGYMVTEKVMVEAPDNGEGDAASSSSSASAAASASASSSASPSSATAAAAAAPKKSPPAFKAAAPAAAAAKPVKAQSGIMNFFGKK